MKLSQPAVAPQCYPQSPPQTCTFRHCLCATSVVAVCVVNVSVTEKKMNFLKCWPMRLYHTMEAVL